MGVALGMNRPVGSEACSYVQALWTGRAARFSDPIAMIRLGDHAAREFLILWVSNGGEQRKYHLSQSDKKRQGNCSHSNLI